MVNEHPRDPSCRGALSLVRLATPCRWPHEVCRMPDGRTDGGTGRALLLPEGTGASVTEDARASTTSLRRLPQGHGAGRLHLVRGMPEGCAGESRPALQGCGGERPLPPVPLAASAGGEAHLPPLRRVQAEPAAAATCVGALPEVHGGRAARPGQEAVPKLHAPATAGMKERQTQKICESRPFCVCVGHPTAWDECCCFTGPDEEADVCEGCDAPMVTIDVDTGDVLS